MGKEIKSRALSCHPSQVAAANEHAKKMGCGEPFQGDGTFVADRAGVKRYVTEINRERPEGQPRIVNYDGGYGDPT